MKDKAQFARLWARAPAVRWLTLGACALSAAFVAFPPIAARAPDSAKPPPTPSQNSYVRPAGGAPAPAAAPDASPAPSPQTTASNKPVAAVQANAAIKPPAEAKTPDSLFGRTFRTKVEVAGQSIPLPPGEWTVVVDFPAAGSGAVESVFLVQTSGQRLTRSIIVQVSRPLEGQARGFRRAQQCLRPGLLYTKVEANEEFGAQDCWTINHNLTWTWAQRDAAPVYRAAVGELKVRGIALSPVMLSVYFRLADKTRFAHVVYYFDPEAEGLASSAVGSWEESDWNRQYIQQYPDKLAYVTRLRAWGDGWHPRVREAFQSAAATGGARARAN